MLPVKSRWILIDDFNNLNLLRMQRSSMRSKGEIDVGQVAKRFGGGGHKNAAGCTVKGPLPGVRVRVLEAAERLLI